MTEKKNSNNGMMLLLVPVLIVALAFLAYKYLVTPLLTQKKELNDTKYELQVRKIELQNLKQREVEFKDSIETARTKVNASLNKFSGGYSPEKSIMFAVPLEGEDITFDALTFNQKQLVTSMNLPIVNDTENGSYSISYSDIELYGEELVISYSCGYESLKALADHISTYPDRMNLKRADVSYNVDDGLLSGILGINIYSVVGGEKEYVAPVVSDIRLGEENIFTN